MTIGIVGLPHYFPDGFYLITMDKKYVVYQHVTPDGMYYFGQTNDIKRRWEGNGAGYKTTALQPYIEKYGWENIQHIILFRDQSKENALWIEDFLIETAREDGVCINKKRSGNISKEEGYFQQYYEENKQQILECRQQYYEQNREKELEQSRQRYQKNKDEINERRRQRYQKNKDEINERSRQRYQKNRDKRLEQSRQRYQKNKDEINERRRQRYQRKKEEKQLKEFGNLPLW